MWKKVASVMIVLIFMVSIGAFGIIDYYYKKMNTVPAEDKNIKNVGNVKDNNVNDMAFSVDTDEDLKKVSKLDLTIENLNKSKTDIQFNDNVFNILLIGADSRNEETDRGRSDSMILVSVNKETKAITLTSFMRDMYVPINGHGNNRLNSAYSFGGVELLKETLENSFKVHIDRYVKVGFKAFEDVVDFCGGIDQMELTAEEVKNLNRNIREINIVNGKKINKGVLNERKRKNEEKTNIYSLTGQQALAYARIRYAANGTEKDDFGRTSRQREVLLKLFDKIKSLNVIELNKLMEQILPQITTDMEKGEIISLLLGYMDYKNYNICQQRIPIDGSYKPEKINGMSVLGVDFQKNTDFLIEKIYE